MMDYTRNKKAISETITDVIKQKSLFAKNKLILIDEVDGVSGKHDRGGVSELSKIIKESKYPICFTANDKESDKIKTLKKLCTYIDFENHSQELLKKTAQKIFTKENIKYDEKDLEEFIEERNTTDIRGFINDLQASVYNSKFELNEKLELRDCNACGAINEVVQPVSHKGKSYCTKCLVEDTSGERMKESDPKSWLFGQLMDPDYSKLSDVEIDGVDGNDYPDFVDAYISSAKYDGIEMTEEHLEELEDDKGYSEFVQERAMNQFCGI